ncbi:MAG: hypothetical protein LBC64_05505 [Fibromonadaceae bacterium]|nr:hypothetical protein [Fibromonadaceae bacterium]
MSSTETTYPFQPRTQGGNCGAWLVSGEADFSTPHTRRKRLTKTERRFTRVFNPAHKAETISKSVGWWQWIFQPRTQGGNLCAHGIRWASQLSTPHTRRKCSPVHFRAGRRPFNPAHKAEIKPRPHRLWLTFFQPRTKGGNLSTLTAGEPTALSTPHARRK